MSKCIKDHNVQIFWPEYFQMFKPVLCHALGICLSHFWGSEMVIYWEIHIKNTEINKICMFCVIYQLPWQRREKEVTLKKM